MNMTLEVLVATMNQTDHSLLEKMNISSNAVVVNQCGKDDVTDFKYKDYAVKWIDSSETGLSRSRNLALKNASADICLIADDDEVLRDDYVNTIVGAFNRCNEDILRFEVRGIERVNKIYSKKKEYKVSYLQSLKTASWEIAFLRKSIIDNNIMFDTRIGAGTEFKMGEENAFLFACFHKKLTMRNIPVVIADLHLGNSSWFEGYNEQYFIGRGAAFTAMKTKIVHLLIFQFAIRKHKLFKDDCSIIKAIQLMEKGRKMYLYES